MDSSFDLGRGREGGLRQHPVQCHLGNFCCLVVKVDPKILFSIRLEAHGWSRRPTASTKTTSLWLQSRSLSCLDFTTGAKSRNPTGAVKFSSYPNLHFQEENTSGRDFCPRKLHNNWGQSERHSTASLRWVKFIPSIFPSISDSRLIRCHLTL